MYRDCIVTLLGTNYDISWALEKKKFEPKINELTA